MRDWLISILEKDGEVLLKTALSHLSTTYQELKPLIDELAILKDDSLTFRTFQLSNLNSKLTDQ